MIDPTTPPSLKPTKYHKTYDSSPLFLVSAPNFFDSSSHHKIAAQSNRVDQEKIPHMPASIQESHHHAPPQLLSRSQRRFVFFFLKCVIMVIVMSLFLFFLGFAAIVLLHFLFMSNTFHRRCTRLLHPAAVASPDIQALIPEFTFRSKDSPATSDCAICLDCFQEGDNCRRIPVCRHLFHAKCVDRWIGKKPTCPVCRTRVDLDPPGLRIGGEDQLKRLWSVDFEEGTSY